MKLRGCSIKFRNHFKQLVVPSKTYVDFECNVKGVKSNYKNNALYTKKYQDHISCNFANQFVYIYDRFSKPVVLDRGKNAVDKFIKAIHKEYDYCKKKKKKEKNNNKKAFWQNLVMSPGDREIFQSSNKCWVCNNLFEVADNKVKDHCHNKNKYRKI